MIDFFKKNVLLKNYTTFRIGGPAKYFFKAKTKEDLIKAIQAAKKLNLPFFILGEGSNILFSDKGFKGLVIKIQSSKIENKETENKNKIIYVEAGVKLSHLVKLSLKNSLTGLEWAAGIPGTVGGAIRGNTGAFGGSMSDIVRSVEVLHLPESEIKNYELKNCKFSYKENIFKKNKNLIILSCILELKKGDKKEIEEKIKYFLDYREKNHPLEFFSAGCIFKNPKKKSAGELIEKCGLKGKEIGDARISEKHANFIVNLGKAHSEDVLKLINLIKKEVKKKFGIELKEEIYFIKSY